MMGHHSVQPAGLVNNFCFFPTLEIEVRHPHPVLLPLQIEHDPRELQDYGLDDPMWSEEAEFARRTALKDRSRAQSRAWPTPLPLSPASPSEAPITNGKNGLEDAVESHGRSAKPDSLQRDGELIPNPLNSSQLALPTSPPPPIVQRRYITDSTSTQNNLKR